MSFVRSTLLASPLILGIALVWSGVGTKTSVPVRFAVPTLPSHEPARLPESSSPARSSAPPPEPPPEDPTDLLFHVNRERAIPADFPLGMYSPWTPCLGALPRGVAERARDLLCLPRKYALRSPEALRERAWDAPAPEATRTHDDLPVGEGGRVGLRPLLDAALKQGHELRIRSGFRPYGSQAAIFRSWVRQQRLLGFAEDEATRRASASSAHAGHSEHQLGTTVDLVYREPGGRFYEGWDAQKIAASPPMQWVEANAHRFGLVVSYGRETSRVTQYVWEPWHLRFVGVEVADEVHRRRISLEAFLQERYGTPPPPPFALPGDP